MKVEVCMSILTVWLIFELKDFFNNGGFSNVLAAGLMKIFLILILMTVISLMAFTMKILPGVFINLINADILGYFAMGDKNNKKGFEKLGVNKDANPFPIIRKKSF